ncbi:MAG: hypothetical protein WD876_03855 [Candidatus Pacearchaeota archaeon]
MEKKSLLILLLILVSIPVVVSIPQFLLFQGQATLDGRPALEVPIIFSIEGTQIASKTTDANGKYGPILIQGFSKHYGKQFNITINGYESEQKIDYIYPQDIHLNLSALTGDALKTVTSFPVEKEIRVSQAGVQRFSISTETGYDDSVNHTWFLDGEEAKSFSDVNSSSFEYTVLNNDNGTHRIEIFATDGFLTVSEEWILIIERPETSGFDGDTTDFDSLGLDEVGSVQNVILEKVGKGKIEFLEDLNLTGVTDLNNKVKIERGIVAIDTSVYPQLNKPARITFTGLRYNTIPKIFYNNGFTTNPFLINQECDFCNILNYTQHPTMNGVVVFEVEHFSSFMAGESGNKYNLSLFGDLDTCEVGVIGDLDLDIKNPKERDEFGVKDEIRVRFDIRNNADEDKRIIVEISLYNIDRDDEVDVIEDNQKIRKNDKERFDLTIEVPDDFEEDNYLIFVKAYEKGNENLQCIQEAIGIDLEREKHDVIIKDFSINPESVTAGRNLDIFVEIQNIGKSDEDVYLIAEIKELNVSTKSEIFELEEFGKKDAISKTLSLKIPNNVEKGNYTINIKTVFDGDEDEKTAMVSVLEVVPIIREMIDLTIKKEFQEIKETPQIQKTPKAPKKDFEIPPGVPILLALGIGILILLIAIVIVVKGRR